MALNVNERNAVLDFGRMICEGSEQLQRSTTLYYDGYPRLVGEIVDCAIASRDENGVLRVGAYPLVCDHVLCAVSSRMMANNLVTAARMCIHIVDKYLGSRDDLMVAAVGVQWDGVSDAVVFVGARWWGDVESGHFAVDSAASDGVR